MKRALLALMVGFILLGFSGLSAAQGHNTLQFWITETQPERAERIRQIMTDFTETTQVEVQLVLIDENTLDSVITANFAAGTLPDVILHPVDYTAVWFSAGILDNAAATEVINELGIDLFSALESVEDDSGGYMAVPTDAWGQLLIYRKDLFDAAGLEAPTTFDAILAAAEALHDPENSFYAIALATDPREVYTQQTFEHFALANGVQLADAEGNIKLNTPAMVDTLAFYANLATSYGPPGVQNMASTRATYLSGQAAMTIWSPFILDEMAGLHDRILPTCAECVDNPAFLAENSGFIPAFIGPGADEPVQYGQVSALGITTSAAPEAIDFVQFWLSEGYIDWLSTAPEGLFPMRSGTANNPNEYIDGWRQIEVGVDTEATLADFYSEDLTNTLAEGAVSFVRWGFGQGQGALVGGIYRQLPIPRYLNEVITGSLSAEAAAEEIQSAIETIQETLAG